MKTKVLLDFIDAINCADLNAMVDLMADNFTFIDSRDNRCTGKENMKQAWIEYFNLFPDYNIEITGMLKKKSLFYLVGYAGGTYKNLKNEENSNYWRIPAAWSAMIKKNKVQNWQVYADNSVVVELLNRNEAVQTIN